MLDPDQHSCSRAVHALLLLCLGPLLRGGRQRRLTGLRIQRQLNLDLADTRFNVSVDAFTASIRPFLRGQLSQQLAVFGCLLYTSPSPRD